VGIAVLWRSGRALRSASLVVALAALALSAGASALGSSGHATGGVYVISFRGEWHQVTTSTAPAAQAPTRRVEVDGRWTSPFARISTRNPSSELTAARLVQDRDAMRAGRPPRGSGSRFRSSPLHDDERLEGTITIRVVG
jgi:hypothetical protein